MKKNVAFVFMLLCSGIAAHAQVCANFDFETGNFWGWTGATGDNQTSSLGPLDNIMPGLVSTTTDALLSDVNARHTIVTSVSGNDGCGGFPAVYPGGSYSVRLGGTTPNYQGEILEQTFMVTPADTLLTAYYAVVLNDGGHAPNDQPYFRIDVLDNASNPVPGGSIYISAADTGSVQCQPSVFYRPWTTAVFNLAAYVNTTVTLRFTAAGCTQSGHYGYAYVDASCPSSSVGMAETIYRKIKLSPNPANSHFNITLPETTTGQQLEVTITDSQGKLVYSSKVPSAHGTQALTIDAESWAKGMYTILIKGEHLIIHEKLIKI